MILSYCDFKLSIKFDKILIFSSLLNSSDSVKFNNWKFDEQQLFVEHILVGRWPKLKRMKFASRSRMHQYVHHRSYVKVILWVN